MLSTKWFSLHVEVHIMLGTSDNNLCLFSIESKLVPPGIVGNDVQGSLQATGAVGEQVGIVSDTDSSGANGANVEVKVGAVQAEETGVYVELEIAIGPHMTLPIFISYHYVDLDTEDGRTLDP